MTFQVAFYKGTPEGWHGIYNKLVRWWTKSKYSHAELVFSDGWMASSSLMDKGVRLKPASLNPDNWDVMSLRDNLEPAARQWFENHKGLSYDVWGNIHILLPFIPQSNSKYFCSEACMAALGFDEAERYTPAAMVSAIKYITK